MPSNVERVDVRVNHPMDLEGTFPSRASVGREPNNSSPEVTILSHDGVGSRSGTPTHARPLKIGAGVWNDICSRILHYVSDWTDVWNYGVVPATALISLPSLR